jgi:hypothetical protein
VGCPRVALTIAWVWSVSCAYHARDLERDAGALPDAAAVDADPGAPDAPPPPIDGLPDASAPDAASCPSGYTERVPGSCYRFDDTPRTWQDAEADCETAGAHLAVVDSSEEDTYVTGNRWIGFTEIVTPGTFVWVTGATITHTGWASGEPGAVGGASCVESRSDGWHDDNCPELKPYACEHDGTPADPSQF